MAKLIRFKNVGYGDYKCACCNKVHLEGLYNVVGDEDDDEGFEWRGFCDNCWNDLKEKSNEELYSSFETNE